MAHSRRSHQGIRESLVGSECSNLKGEYHA